MLLKRRIGGKGELMSAIHRSLYPGEGRCRIGWKKGSYAPPDCRGSWRFRTGMVRAVWLGRWVFRGRCSGPMSWARASWTRTMGSTVVQVLLIGVPKPQDGCWGKQHNSKGKIMGNGTPKQYYIGLLINLGEWWLDLHLILEKGHFRGTWVAQLSVQFLISAQIMISGSWDRAPHWALRSAEVLLGILSPLSPVSLLMLVHSLSVQ